MSASDQEFDLRRNSAAFPRSRAPGFGNGLLDEIFRICRRVQPFFFPGKTRSLISPRTVSRRRNHPRESHSRALHHELPYAVAVFVEKKFEDNPRLLRIESRCSTSSAIRKRKFSSATKGAMLKKKSARKARKELEGSAGQGKGLSRLYFVKKLAQDWRENPPWRVRNWTGIFSSRGLSSAQVDPGRRAGRGKNVE